MTAASADLSGNVTGDGNSPVTTRGFVISATAANADPPAAGGTGVFSLNVGGLSPGPPYSFKAYATNAVGTSYSATASFTTTAAVDPCSNSVFISEFLSDNPGPVVLPGSALDMDGDSSDWIELHNAGATVADLSGWKLSDDPLQPALRVFPAGVTMQPGARLLVFASGKDRRTAGVELHTGFKLGNSGILRLARPDPTGADVVLSHISYNAQSSRASFGSTTVPPDTPVFGYFTTPTAGGANGTFSVPGFVSGPVTDIDRGLFTDPFSINISCPTPGVTLLYTLDGSVPTEGGAATVSIPPPAHFPAAVAWSHYGTADWAMDPDIVNHADPANRCTMDDLMAIPSVSLVMDWTGLFGTSGIYPAISPVPEEGLDKAANLELLNSTASNSAPNSGETFSVQSRGHVFGDTSQTRWKVDKLSFNFNVDGTVDSNIYGDTATGTYGRFILDARMGNTWLHATDDVQHARGDYIRDEVASEA